MPDELNPGDLVYHTKHGTAKYLGTERVDSVEFHALEFAGGDKILVPLRNAHHLEKVPPDGATRPDRLRQSGATPPPPRSLILDRTRVARLSDGGKRRKEDPLLEAAEQASSERREIVERARQHWIGRLIDLSRRNRLLFFSPLKVRTVELTEQQTQRVLPLIGGEAVRLSDVFGKSELVKGDEEEELLSDIEDIENVDLGVVRKLQEIQKRGDEDFEERGLETVYLAYGMATWKPADGGRAPQAAVIMVPIGLQGKIGRMTLFPHADLEVNLALVHVLEEEFGCAGLGERIDEVLASSDEQTPHQRAQAILDTVSAEAGGVPSFTISPKAVIGNFAFQKLAMVRDLERWQHHMAGHDIVSAVAGDVGAKTALAEGGTDVDPRELDARPPDAEFLVMDADSSQMRAIEGIVRGDSGVVIGPPGTGKSQTIANLVGQLVATGKTVLFVAEKRAALDVVRNRLEARGLGSLVLDLHGALSRKQIMAQFAAAIDVVRTVTPPRSDQVHTDFADRRARLIGYVNSLHTKREPADLSAYEILGRLLALAESGASSAVRWKGPGLDAMTAHRVAAAEGVLRSAAQEPHLFLGDSTSPWVAARLHDGESASDCVDALDDLSDERMPALNGAIGAVMDALGVHEPATVEQAQLLAGGLTSANELADLYSVELYDADLGGLSRALAPAVHRVKALWATVANREYRAAKSRLNALRAAPAKPRDLLSDVARAIAVRDAWDALGAAGVPRRCAEAENLTLSAGRARAGIEGLRRWLPVPGVDASLAEVQDYLRRLQSTRGDAAKLPIVMRWIAELKELGCSEFLDELKSARSSPDSWIPNLRFAWVSSLYEHLRLKEAGLAVFHGREHDKIVREFQALDRERMELSVARVQRAYAEHAVDASNRHRDEDLLVRKQAAMKARHLPFRELVRRAPNVTTALKPCWMASPLAVSQLLSGTEQVFDVVIFDEASQVLPEDAVTSILRGKSAVVAGDPNQLPPTQFFAAERGDDDEVDDEDVPAGFESILNLMISFLPQFNLDWHYRSRDERLIAFSNHYVYDDRLVTFPSAKTEEAMEHVLVTPSHFADSDEQSSSAEVTAVVDLILAHARQSPELSLGVIAMGIKHANRLEAALLRARKEHPEFDGFFDEHQDEKFFIKNLERVQGDERDVIILSIGYGKDSSGKLPYRFGPLLSDGGFRRLNVAVTRAKERVILVSSFSHRDMDPSRSSRRGVELLRLYLEYAASGGAVFGDGGPAPVERNEFEIQVQTALERAGLEVVPQFGASKYRIDMVVRDPDQPGHFVLAVECDGASYHSSPTARDRDRLRQEHLEARGWRFVRIWSTDWFTRRDEEVARVVEAYRRALAQESNPAPEPVAMATESPVEVPASRSVRDPALPRGLTITDYDARELDSVARYIRSDGRLRTDDELLAEMMEYLGFARRGRRVEEALRLAIHRTR